MTPTLDTYLETREVPIGALVHFPGNAKLGDVDAIRASLRKHGQYKSLIVRLQEDGQLVVLVGNNTLKALRAEGREAVRCEIHECDDDTARRINIADNKIASLGIFDDDLLVEQLSYLEGDYDGVGYTHGEVDHLLDGYGPSDDGHEITATSYEEEAGDLADEDDDPPPAKTPPGEFPAYDDDIDTQYCCPKCAYEWSGKPK